MGKKPDDVKAGKKIWSRHLTICIKRNVRAFSQTKQLTKAAKQKAQMSYFHVYLQHMNKCAFDQKHIHTFNNTPGEQIQILFINRPTFNLIIEELIDEKS